MLPLGLSVDMGYKPSTIGRCNSSNEEMCNRVQYKCDVGQ